MPSVAMRSRCRGRSSPAFWSSGSRFGYFWASRSSVSASFARSDAPVVRGRQPLLLELRVDRVERAADEELRIGPVDVPVDELVERGLRDAVRGRRAGRQEVLRDVARQDLARGEQRDDQRQKKGKASHHQRSVRARTAAGRRS
jgi:hypothetical protein